MKNDRFKFRIWDKTRGCFYPNEHGNLHWSLEDTILEEADNDFIQDEMIIEFCIGIKDKNGTLVFCGDILSWGEALREVCWSDTLASFMLDDYSYDENGKYTGSGNLETIFVEEIESAEIVGNIHYGVLKK